jgi:hypothetical protein
MLTANMPTANMLPLLAAPTHVVGTRRIVGFRPPVARYSRTTDLVRLLPLWPEELADGSIAGRTRLVRMLERALRAERQRGVGGHWAYDLSRHANLMWALRAERAALKLLNTQITVPALQTAAPSAKALRPRNTVTIAPRDLPRDLVALP